MKKSMIYAMLLLFAIGAVSCKEDEASQPDDELSFYEFTVQGGALSGKTFRVIEVARETNSTGSITDENQQVTQSNITFFEARNAATYFRIEWDGASARPLNVEFPNDDDKFSFIRLTCEDTDGQVYVFESQSGSFTVAERETIMLTDQITNKSYPTYQFSGTFQGMFRSVSGNETVSISGRLILVPGRN
ncbi:hypothetical protein [Penaeicola halotolerans]|uniref:hypothetical protein n=1 Tax=Penaeicola halotolerans TaxID=2793196 RepID=UPI001CF8B3DF|nr:hypothetical protein [Penaeicola halotolerans]